MSIFHTLPLNNGHIFPQIASGLSREYWPNTSSRKKSGMPQKHRKIIYGIRKAPAMEQE